MNDTQTPGAGPSGTPNPGTSSPRGFFDQLRDLGVRRSSDRWVAGVCGGLARRFNVDPMIMRAALIVLLIFGVGFLAYLVAWALLPDEDGSIVAERAIRDGDGWGIVLLVVIAVSIFGTWAGSNRGWFTPLVAVGVIALVWYLIDQRKKRDGAAGTPPATGAPNPAATHTPPAPSTAHGPTAPQFGHAEPQPAWSGGQTASAGYEPPPAAESASAGATASDQASGAYRSADSRPKRRGAGFAGLLLVIGAAVVGYGIGMLIVGAPMAGLIGATGAAGLATILLGVLGRRSVLSSLLSIALAISLLSSWGVGQVPTGAFGDTTWRPQQASAQNTYSWSMGAATLDLRDYTPAEDGDSQVNASISFGELTVIVPEDVPIRVRATSTFGSISLDGREEASMREDMGGSNVSRTYDFGQGDPEVTVVANARFGAIKIITTVDPSATDSEGR